MVLGRRQPPTTSQDLPQTIPKYVNSSELFICFKYNNDFYLHWKSMNSNSLLWPIHGMVYTYKLPPAPRIGTTSGRILADLPWGKLKRL